jgi:hypothetical protein
MDIARDTLVDSIYEAAGDADQWGVVLQNFGKWAGGFGGLYYLINKATGQFDAIHTGGHTTEAELSYVGYYSALDPHAGVVALTPERTWFLSQEHFTPEFFQTDRFFQEFFTPRGVRWVTGTKPVVTGDGTVLMSNTVAERLFARGDLFKASGPNRVGLRHTKDHLRLCQALLDAVGGDSHAMLMAMARWRHNSPACRCPQVPTSIPTGNAPWCSCC